MKHRISIIVVTYNSASCVADCLQSVRDTVASPYDVHVVDNASRDETVALVAAGFPEMRLTALDDNRGFSAANNVAAGEAEGDYILLLNSDTVARPGALDALAACLDADERVGVSGPLLMGADGRPQISFGRMIGLTSEFLQKTLSEGCARGWPLFARYVAWRSRRQQYPDWVSGACLMVRREIYNSVGGLDENFFMYTEEVDFCTRIRVRGHVVIYEPRAEVLHLGGVSSASNKLKTVIEYRRSQLYFYRKHHGPLSFAVLRLFLLVKYRAQLLASRLFGGRQELIELQRSLLDLVRGARFDAGPP